VPQTLAHWGSAVKADLWINAAIFVIGGIVTLIRGAVLYGVLVIIGLLIGRRA
jgi:hypothetical protein